MPVPETILGPEFYNDSSINLQSVKIFNNSKIGNLTTIKSQDDDSQIKVLSIELYEEENKNH